MAVINNVSAAPLVEMCNPLEIAVISMAGRFPGAPDLDAFWNGLMRGDSTSGPIPLDRWDAERVSDPEVDVPTRAHTIEGAADFDPAFFGISPREIEHIDPQQRLLMELAWECLEDAGRPARELRGSRVGVYVGAGWNDYDRLTTRNASTTTLHTAPGMAMDMLAERISYFLGLRGPSMVVQTGCSSSLVALHLACQALRAGEIQAAFVGGAQLMFDPFVSIALSHFGGLSADGVCRAFGTGANGFVRGEGGGLLYLKRLEDALADGDRVQAVVRGTAVNNDGGGKSIVTPLPDGQRDVLGMAYDRYGLPVERLGYVETHGTGTAVGDPVEAEALGAVLGARRRPGEPLPIGSVKTNVGHLESAAGMPALIKAVLALEHGVVPPSLNSEVLNPEIDFDALNLTVVHNSMPLREDALVGVSGFGWGGTNAHVVLGRGPGFVRKDDIENKPAAAYVLPVSGHSAPALRARVSQVCDLLSEGAELGSLARSLGSHQQHLAHRLAVVCADRSEAQARFSAWLEGAQDDAVATGYGKEEPTTAFVFPGQGSQWHEMARDLLVHEPAFAESMTRCAAALQPLTGRDLIATLNGEEGEGWLQDVMQVQSALWAMAVSLADVWRAHGVEPDVVIGHSQGEVAAATVAGILSVEDAARVVVVRSQLVQPLSGKGLMLAVDMTQEEAAEALQGFEAGVSIAVNNGPRSCVLSGDTDMIMVLKEILELSGTYCSLVRVDYASHSPQMDSLHEQILTQLEGIVPQSGAVPMMSTVRGTLVEGPELDAAYWFDNLRQPVQFASCVERLLDDGVTHLLEVSAHPLLSHSLTELAERTGASVLTTLRREEGSARHAASALARAYVSGLTPFPPEPGPAPLALPHYPWQRSRHWKEVPASDSGLDTIEDALVMVPDLTRKNVWSGQVIADPLRTSWLDHHQVHGAAVVAGACMMDLAQRCHQGIENAYRRLEKISFVDAIVLGEGATALQFEVVHDRHDSAALALWSLPQGGAEWVHHFSARAEGNAGSPTPLSVASSTEPTIAQEGAVFYANCAERGLQYEEAFQGVQRVEFGHDSCIADIMATRVAEHPAWRGKTWPHPVLLDAILQSVIPLVEGSSAAVPTGIESVDVLCDEFPHHVQARAVRDGERFHIDVISDDGSLVMAVRGLTMAVLQGSQEGSLPAEWHMTFEPCEAEPEDLHGRTVQMWDIAGRAEAVVEVLRARGASVESWQASVSGTYNEIVLVPPPAENPDEAEHVLAQLLECLRDCAEGGRSPAVSIVTYEATSNGVSIDPAATMAWGVGRVVRAEFPELRCRLVDVVGDTDPQRIATALTWAREAQTIEDQLRVVDDIVERGRYVVGRSTELADMDLPRSQEPDFRCDYLPGRSFEGVVFHPLERQKPGVGELEIEISHTSLNFIDVMKVMGIYPDESGTRPGLGLDCAGTVTRVGPGVDLQVGERVVTAVDAGALATHIIAQARHTQLVPATMDNQTAAALPSVMMTAWHALVDLAGLRSGEVVLIHSAAGGLGLAAIGVARHIGAEVILTAGTPEKRAYLTDLGIEHVFDSRGLDWADDVLAATAGEGVDVVLNSLTGAGLQRGMEVLRDGGRFIEVGKRDIYGGQQIPMSVLKPGVSISSLDLTRILRRRPDLYGDILARVWSPICAGMIPTLPIISRPMAHASEALAELSHGSHIGKFVLSVAGERPDVVVAPFQNSRFRSDGTYLITGGLGALGLSLGRFMAQHGAGHLVLVGRSGPTPQILSMIDEIRAIGTDVEVRNLDVADAAQVQDLVALLPDLRGVVHAAGLLDDATIATVTPEQITRVMAPKVRGVVNLDKATRDRELDLFVTFSSAAGLFGNAGQVVYSASNCYMDGVVTRRRACGVVGLSVQWGPFTEVGLAAADNARGERLSDRGMQGFTTDQAWDRLTQMLVGGDTVTSHVPMDVTAYFDSYPQNRNYGSFAAMSSTTACGDDHASGSMLTALHGLDEAERLAVLEAHVQGQVGHVLRIQAEDMDPQTPFKSLGLDSLMSIELRNRLEATTGLRLSPTLLWTYGTPSSLARALDGLLQAVVEQQEFPAAAPNLMGAS